MYPYIYTQERILGLRNTAATSLKASIAGYSQKPITKEIRIAKLKVQAVPHYRKTTKFNDDNSIRVKQETCSI